MVELPGLRAKVRAEIRRQWRRYAVSIWVQIGATIAILMWMLFAHWDGLRSYVGTFLVAAMFAAFAAVAVHGNALDPHTWFRSAVHFSGASWLIGLGAMLSNQPPPPETALVLVSLVVLCVITWIPAGRAKTNGEAELGYAGLMEDENFGRRFEGRDNGVVFEVDNVKVMMTCTVRSRRYFDEKSGTWYLRGIGNNVMIVGCSLGDIKKLRAVYLRTKRTCPVPGSPGYALELTPGQALRFDSPRGEWIVPINRAQEAFAAIKDKRGKFIHQPGLNSFLPGGP